MSHLGSVAADSDEGVTTKMRVFHGRRVPCMLIECVPESSRVVRVIPDDQLRLQLHMYSSSISMLAVKLERYFTLYYTCACGRPTWVGWVFDFAKPSLCEANWK